MLKVLFSSIKNQDINVLMLEGIINISSLKSEHKNSLSRRRGLMGDLQVARLRGGPLSGLSESIANEDQYLQFLSSCERALGDGDCILPHLLLLKIALNEDAFSVEIRVMINQIFSILLQQHTQIALTFYSEHRLQFEDMLPVNLMGSREDIKNHLVSLTRKLSAQKDPLSLSIFLSTFVDETEKFAAAILWLLHRGVPVQQILQTELLQNFMLYHVAWLGASGNPVSYLYQLLGSFKEANELVLAAGKVRCEARGFESYAITGALNPDSCLARVEIRHSPLRFTATSENFHALSRLFGRQFLASALIWQMSNGNILWLEELRRALNNQETVARHLPGIIKDIHQKTHPKRLQVLASLIEDASLAKLMEEHSWSVLYLLPHKIGLLKNVHQQDMARYVASMRIAGEDIWTMTPLLFNVLLALRDVNIDAASSVYDELLDLIMQYPILLDDKDILKKLNQFPRAATLIMQRRASLQHAFDVCVSDQLAVGELTAVGYQRAEDAWLHVDCKLRVLQKIMPSLTVDVMDKHAFRSFLAKKWFLAQPGLDINDFIRATGVERVLSAEVVNEYERLLIALLTTIDDEVVRDKLIGLLTAHPTRGCAWMTHVYAENTVSQWAVLRGNVGLLKWLRSKTAENQSEVDQSVMIAANTSQWGVVHHYLVSSASAPQPSRSVCKKLFMLAIQAGQLKLLDYAYSRIKRDLKEADLLLAAKKAVHYGHEAVMQFLCQVNAKSHMDVLVIVLNDAIQHGRYALFSYIDHLHANTTLAAVVREGLVVAAQKGQLQTVQQLCALIRNRPNSYALKMAFFESLKHNHKSIADYLQGEMTALVLVKEAIDYALNELTKIGGIDGVMYLCCSKSKIYPDLKVLDFALRQAVQLNHSELVAYFCSLKSNGPSLSTKHALLLETATNGALGNFEHLCNGVSKKIMKRAMELAAQHGRLVILQYCVDFCHPNVEILRISIEKARHGGHEHVIFYLEDRLAKELAAAGNLGGVETAKSLTRAKHSFEFFSSAVSSSGLADTALNLPLSHPSSGLIAPR